MKLFVGGWGGSGTRVVQYWLQTMNVYVGDRTAPSFNWAMDYLPILQPFLQTLASETPELLNDDEYMDGVRFEIGTNTENCENWSLKHGHLMFSPKFCKVLYPDCKFLLVVRHGVDNILNNCTLAEQFPHLGRPPRPSFIENRMAFWSATHVDAIHDAQDLFGDDFQIMRLEDMIFEPGAALSMLEKFTGIEAKPGARNTCLDFITLPESVGRRFKTHDNYSPLENLKTLYSVGEEGLRSLGYAPW